MTKIVKFVYVIIIFISLLVVAMDVDGTHFVSYTSFSNYFLYYISSHFTKIIYSTFFFLFFFFFFSVSIFFFFFFFFFFWFWFSKIIFFFFFFFFFFFISAGPIRICSDDDDCIGYWCPLSIQPRSTKPICRLVEKASKRSRAPVGLCTCI